MPTIDFLARALCAGFYGSPEALGRLQTTQSVRHGFVHGAVFMLNARRPVNTVLHSLTPPNSEAIELRPVGEKLFGVDGSQLVEVKLIDEPTTITSASTSDGRSLRDYFSLHSPRTLFATPLRECVFAREGNVCTFCTFEAGPMRPLAPADFVDAVEKIVDELGFVPAIAIGPGTPNTRDHGAKYFAHLVRAVKAKFSAEISVEMVPPHALADLHELLDSGVDSMIMSLEIWNDEIRKRHCPGKSYVTKAHYLAAHELVTGRLGPGMSSSVLIAGLESDEDTITGLRELTDRKVVPTVIPFRPYPGTALQTHPYTPVGRYLRLADANQSFMRSNSIGPQLQKGCTECGGCSIDTTTEWTHHKTIQLQPVKLPHTSTGTTR